MNGNCTELVGSSAILPRPSIPMTVRTEPTLQIGPFVFQDAPAVRELFLIVNRMLAPSHLKS
jgi:hypothetical protein